MAHEELESLSMRDLGDRARKLGLTSIAHMHPEELMEAVREHEDLTKVTAQEAAM